MKYNSEGHLFLNESDKGNRDKEICLAQVVYVYSGHGKEYSLPRKCIKNRFGPIDTDESIKSTSKEITSHRAGGNALNDAIIIKTSGEAGAGGAFTRYNLIGNGEDIPNIGPRPFGVNLRFQDGKVEDLKDMNGITNEALLAVLIDRLEGFQTSPFKCRDNAVALTHLEEALMWLQKRTRERLARGVEGSLIP